LSTPTTKNFDEWRIPLEAGKDPDVDAFLARRYTSAMYADHVWQAEVATLVEVGIAEPENSDYDHGGRADASGVGSSRR
jgi:hypothetical protein